jgi:hypothetical protein
VSVIGLSRIVRLERRHLFRSPRGRAVLASLSLLTLASVFVGGAVARTHRSAGDRDEGATWARIRESAGEAAVALRTSTSAIGSRPGAQAGAASQITSFDLAAWNDSFVARGDSPSTPLIAGDLALLPDSAAIRIYEPPTAVPSLAERSPAALILGTIDLAWLLALLLPLAAIALGFDAVARDRERGTLAMLLAPAGSGRALFFARVVASFSLLWIGVVPAAMIAWALSTHGLRVRDALSVCALLTGLIAFIASVVIAVSALADRSATSLATLIAGWLILFVALPLASSGLVRTAYPLPDPRARLEGELAAQDVFSRPSSAVLDREAERDPKLDPSLGQDGTSIQNRYYMLLSRERYRRAKGARHEEEQVLEQRAELAEILLWSSPPTIVSFALAELAGTGPRERGEFLEDGDAYRAAVERFVRDRVVANERAFDQSSADRWPRLDRPDRRSSLTALGAGLAFLILGIVVAVVAGAWMDRKDLAPTREDA